MNFKEYEQGGRLRYLALVDAIQTILRHALKQHDLTAHAITGRAKELVSLRKKLGAREIRLDQPMDEIKDLAGCRIVFLTNSQVDTFHNTRLLANNFEIISVNVHHPVPGTNTETQLFDSTNYLVRLKPDRLSLPEYQDFQELRAEIQVQTLLNHAWAEMGHDTIYKEPTLRHLGAAKMTEIGERMNKVMQDHLAPAGHDFDKIAKDFRQLLDADRAVESSLDAILYADNNNDLEDALGTYADLILPHFDNPAAEFSKLLDSFTGAVERARKYTVVPIETPYGNFLGKSSLDVARRFSVLIRPYRYWETKRIFHTLIRLYSGAGAEDERRIWIEVAQEFAEHNLDVWKQCGPAVQQTILAEIKQLERKQVKECRPLLTAMLARVLSPDLAGISSRSDSVTFHQGAVPPSDALCRLREESVDWLEQWLNAADCDSERLVVLQALSNADTVPMRGSVDASLFLMLLRDATRVARIVLARAPSWGLELRRGREVDALQTHYRFHALPTELAEHPEVVAKQKELIDVILCLRDQLASDEEFMIYKTLVGYDSVRPNAWDGDHFDFNATQIWRLGQYPVLVDLVTSETVPAWRGRIDSYVDTVGQDGGHLQPMREFLSLVAEKKPDVAVQMLEEVSVQRTRFLCAMLAGLDRAGRNENALSLFDRWLGAGQFLPELGNYLKRTSEADLKRLKEYVRKAIEQGDQNSAVNAATTAAVWYQRKPDGVLIDAVLMPVVQFASAHRIPGWIRSFYTMGNESILHALNEQQSAELLDSFVDIADVEYWALQLLVGVGLRYPHLVTSFFDARLHRERDAKGTRFEPVPFHLHNLAQILSPHVDLLLSAARRWYEIKPSLHQFRGGRLLKHVFPELTDQIAAKLIDLAHRGDKNDLEFIVETLSPYEGAVHIYPICMEVIDRLESGDKLLDKVSHVLDVTGVVHGEFGFVEARALRQNLIERYRTDPRPRVQAYANDRYRELAQDMAWEQRRADREVAQRRRDWGED